LLLQALKEPGQSWGAAVRFVYFTHSLGSCWNHGNAHFVRGVLRELLARGHDASSSTNLPDIDTILDKADVVLVHDWNDPALIAAIGKRRKHGRGFVLLFHDTHHRGISDTDAVHRLDLSGYDGVLAFGDALAEVYRRTGWGARVFTWHEAADTRLFCPPAVEQHREGAVWIGNWGDDERSTELQSYLLAPTQELNLPLDVYGVRYPEHAREMLRAHGASHRGWPSNASVPQVFSRYMMTVDVPRRDYAQLLPGIPTIRVFEALACGIPLICAPWHDSEALFQPGQDYLLANCPGKMTDCMRALKADPALRQSLAQHGLATIRSRHTCGHRVDQLLAIVERLTAVQQVAA